MADYDHISVYRQFFEEFAKTSDTEVSRPMRVNPYDLSVDELVGEVMHSCLNYLVERKCPRSLVVPLTKIVVEEFIKEAKKEPEEVNTPLKLNRKTHDKISEVCLRFTDNEKLSSLPVPMEEVYYSTHSTKHIRRRMEDRFICLPRFHALHNIQSNSEAGYYGIFDGHSGVNAASYTASHLHQFLAESEYYPDNPVQAFRQAFEKTESKYNLKDENSGTTVLAILHQPVEKKLTVAWVGDSQAMLAYEDSFVMLIDPHKPERVDERKRIEALGGCIIKDQGVYRVNGELAVSRAIGDKKLKPYISAEPEIRVLNLTGSEHFIVMGCDGLWDVVEPQEVIETVYFEVKKNQGQVDSVARRLVDLAKENNSTDNISVIVIFLTDPAEISKLSVDVTGLRPKILHQDGVIMEANFPANDKSPFNDPGMNGIYETNGNLYSDHMQNEFDEDFGPETNVDTVDDALTSTKNSNPFTKDCWQEKTDENSDKLIESPLRIEGEIVMITKDFAESTKSADDKNSSLISEKCSVDNINPFETPVTNNLSESFNISHNFIEDSNKYADEINSRKEEVERLMSPKILDQFFDLKNNSEEQKNLQEISENNHFKFSGDREINPNQIAFDTTLKNTNFFFNEEFKPKLEEGIENSALDTETQKESELEFNRKFEVAEAENNSLHSKEINTTLNKVNELRELNFKVDEEGTNLIEQEQSAPLDVSENHPVLCSVINTLETEKASCDFSGKNIASETKGELSSELLSPSAFALGEDLKDETVAESGGEVEDSEDDEWNYIKVESGAQQVVPVNKVSELISSNEFSETEKPTMNSPLNPEADEFIPVSAMSDNNEYRINVTPKKAIPDDLTDIIASSPNWNNMNNVSLPEESAFLNEIKSRPSNINIENIDSPVREDFGEKNITVNKSLSFTAFEEMDKENELVTFNKKEPHGIDLANDMTSSFIDPSTMSTDMEMPKEKADLINFQSEKPIVEKQKLFFNENAPKVQESTNEEFSSKLPDLLPPVPAQEVSPDTPSFDVLNVDAVETPVIVSEPVTFDTSQPTIQSTDVQEKKCDGTTQLYEEAQILSETFSKSPNDENEVSAAVSVVTTALGTATAAEAATTKKDVKKSATAATSTKKVVLNGTKTSTTTKKFTTQTTKPAVSGKTTGGITPLSASKTFVTTKTQLKSTPITSIINKAPARSRPQFPVSTALKGSPLKTTVTANPKKLTTATTTTTATITTATNSSRGSSNNNINNSNSNSNNNSDNKNNNNNNNNSNDSINCKSNNNNISAPLKPANKTPGPTSVAATLKSKPKVSSAKVENKPTSVVNREIKSAVKKAEVSTKKTGGTTNTTTRVSLSARHATTPTKTETLKTTATATKATTAKPKTTISTLLAPSLPPPSSRVSAAGRKSLNSVDKKAKEAANTLASKTTPKFNGISQKSAASTGNKTRKTLTSTKTTTSTLLRAKNHDKTDSKAEKILDEQVQKIQIENMAGLTDSNTDIKK